ncbi:hypothetical protein IQ258_29655, partial [Coleofasciculus sp. LEGE 07081]|uniref:hypothetical protein n=1 Tax=Coleofasciculus sp. LEGE 07081 TaxID=2777967 RepID=UPI00187F3B4F
VTVEGTDEFTVIKPGPGPSTTHEETWIRNWVTGTWTMNGAPNMEEPSIPVSHGIATTTEVEMKSEGTQKVAVQYVGPANQMPAEVGIILISTSEAWFSSLYTGTAITSNGLGDAQVWEPSGGEYGPNGMQGNRSNGKHFRVIKLNESGYGELSFTSSATAKQSGYGAAVWANAKLASVSSDPRSISLICTNDPPVFYEPDHDDATTHYTSFNYNFEGANYVVSFQYEEIPKIPVSPISDALYSEVLKVGIGIDAATSGNQNLYFPLEKLYKGKSFFPYASWPHGTFSWQLTKGDAFPMSGTLPNLFEVEKEAWGFCLRPVYITESQFQGWFMAPIDVTTDFAPQDEDELHIIQFNVVWGDGVKGEARRQVTWMPRSSHINESEVFTLSYTNAQSGTRNAIPIAATGNNVSGGWVSSGMAGDEATFIDHPWTELISGINDVNGFLSSLNGSVKAGMTLPAVQTAITNNPIASKVMTAIDIGQTLFLEQVLDDTTFTSNRNYHPAGVFDELGIDITTAYNDDPRNYEWQLWMKPNYYVKLFCDMNYGPDGYQGNSLKQAIDRDRASHAPLGITARRRIVNPGE